MSSYSPPYTITPTITRLIAEIGETLGRWSVSSSGPDTPRLRRGNRLRTIQASLEIENNTLDLEQVTAVIEGQRILGSPREIQEVKGAFAAYERMAEWEPSSGNDLLNAHGVLMAGLIAHPGVFRTRGVGIQKGQEVVHVAPPASRVPKLMSDLLAWSAETEEHPLVASCVFHYEFEFIHPFMDGNGRLGRLWQTLTLSRWKPVLAWLPVETVIRDRQGGYYDDLNRSDKRGDATPFIEFMLEALAIAMEEVVRTDHDSDHPGDHVKNLIRILDKGPLGTPGLMTKLKHRPTFRQNYLHPALSAGWIEMTEPDSPQSRTQKYRLTERGRTVLKTGLKRL